ncbi:CubicO group peptidase (beta-lactamase class C family) [Microbacterium resistens]|uniref:CubicO group peptidase (Beta-lactamase class C family) n=1 Tax=Microbacterium resistens TaxID=156977 RepID=A0ABU1S7V0_9MICO|nr:serine hydrolase domain-containing protein [Microbacterium resistens]MDR6865700.1 CubicO group peptidase (beta-lactamase class C family) [Microbacterium resistens]
MIDDLQHELDAMAAELEVPGIAVGIVDGDADHVLTTGVASAETGTPVTEGTLFAIGSTSKTVTATAAMRLVEEGALSLDAPVAEILPNLRLEDPDALAALRVRHLLTHSGGFLGDADGADGWGDDALERSVEGIDPLPQLFPPGALTSYSNSGLRVLGRIVAVVADGVFEEVVRETVFEPLGMTESVYHPWDALTRPHAVGHTVTDGIAAVPRTWPLGRGMAPEGGVLSTVGDQLRYARFHLRGESTGTAPLGDATRLRMQEPQIAASPPMDAIGLPWLIRRQGDARIVEHGGNVSNLQLSAFALAPDHDLAVTVLTNSAGGKEAGTRILAWCLDRLRGVRAGEPEEVAAASDPTADDLRGRYDVNQWQWIVDREGDELVISSELRADLAAQGIPPLPTVRGRLGDDLVIRSAGGQPIGRFLTTADGHEFLHLGMRAARRI